MWSDNKPVSATTKLPRCILPAIVCRKHTLSGGRGQGWWRGGGVVGVAGWGGRSLRVAGVSEVVGVVVRVVRRVGVVGRAGVGWYGRGGIPGQQ